MLSNDTSQPSSKLDHQLARARDVLRDGRKIAVFTGAGVSAESGVPTFRDLGGFWSRFPPEQFAHWEGLQRLIRDKPLLVAEFVVELLRPIIAARPNPAHESIADLERRDKTVDVITQNIDGLHQRAGSRHVIEIHGSVFETIFLARTGNHVRRLTLDALSATVEELEALLRAGRSSPAEFLNAARGLFGNGASGVYRPNIVLFGDQLPSIAWDKAVEVAATCDCLLIIGTSHLVYPAASIPAIARSSGAKIIAVGLDQCTCDFWLQGPAGRLVPSLITDI